MGVDAVWEGAGVVRRLGEEEGTAVGGDATGGVDHWLVLGGLGEL